MSVDETESEGITLEITEVEEDEPVIDEPDIAKKEIVRDDPSRMKPADFGSLKGTPILTTFS